MNKRDITTPRPWTQAVGVLDPPNIWDAEGQDEIVVCYGLNAGADAALILKAVNSHDEAMRLLVHAERMNQTQLAGGEVTPADCAKLFQLTTEMRGVLDVESARRE